MWRHLWARFLRQRLNSFLKSRVFLSVATHKLSEYLIFLKQPAKNMICSSIRRNSVNLALKKCRAKHQTHTSSNFDIFYLYGEFDIHDILFCYS